MIQIAAKCCTTNCMIRSLTYWNYIKETSYHYSNEICQFFYYLFVYFSKDKWFIIPGHTYPIAVNNVVNDYNQHFRINLWKYDAYKNQLAYHAGPLHDPVTCYKFTWLSAKISAVEDGKFVMEYELDDFISNLRIYNDTDNDNDVYAIMTLHTFLLAWSCKNKIWFSDFALVSLHIIDEMGEEQIIFLDKNKSINENLKKYNKSE
jgi:hypothetical protein